MGHFARPFPHFFTAFVEFHTQLNVRGIMVNKADLASTFLEKD